MNRHPQKTLAAHRWPVAANLCGKPPESNRRVFPPQPAPPKRKKARWQAGLVKHFGPYGTRLAGFCFHRPHVISGLLNSVTVLLPVVHHPYAFLEQVAAPVSGFGLVADGVCECHLGHFVRVGCLLGRPVPERGTEPMHGKVASLHAL